MKYVLIVCVCLGLTSVSLAGEPAWVKPMQKVHEGFKGNAGYVAQLGDSITHSMAFWSVMGWADPSSQLPDDGLPKNPGKQKWKQVLKGARDKGAKHGNYSGWRVGNLVKSVDGVIANKKPEVALLMIGTNDVRGNAVPSGYEATLESIIKKLLNAQCIPIISTIPPMRGKAKGVDGANVIIKKLAAKHHIPLIDYHGEIMKRRPNDWDGTLISKDGIHPSGGKPHVWSKDSLSSSGYALRTYLCFMAYRGVYFKVLQP